MRIRRLGRYTLQALILACVIGVGASASQVMAQSSNSKSYQMVETEFGSGGLSESCSDGFCATTSIGQAGSGGSATAPEFMKAAYTEPILEMIITTGESNLGELTTERTATKIMNVKIRNYLSGGYMLQIIGDPPKYKDHALATPSVPTASKPGSEQFGMNIVKNTTPNIGADPVQEPADAGVFGEAEPGYATANMFKYASGDVFARSTQDSGGTDYTITMIVNISNATPSGHYAGDFSAVLIPAY